MKLLHRFRSDESLMMAFQRGDGYAFEILYTRHKDRLLRFLMVVGGTGLSREIAEELAQDSWTAIIQSAEHYRVEAKFSTYLFTVARHRWIDECRKKKVRIDIDGKHPSSSVDDSFTSQIERETVVEGKMDIAVDHQRVLHAVERLPEDQRLVFVLKETGFSLQEIAQQLNQPSETIKSRLRYARNRLRERFNERPDIAVTMEDAR